MRIKGKKLEWYVLNHDFNTNKIKRQNIFFSDFPEKLRKEMKKRKIGNREQLKEYLKIYLMGYYWSRTECEVLVGDVFSGCGLEKNEQIIQIINAGPYNTAKEQADVLNKLLNIYMEDFEKIDMWYQIEKNLDRITDYVINELDIKFKNREVVEDKDE